LSTRNSCQSPELEQKGSVCSLPLDLGLLEWYVETRFPTHSFSKLKTSIFVKLLISGSAVDYPACKMGWR
jgi:hypothetical protein